MEKKVVFLMNKTTAVTGGIILIVLAGAFYYYSTQRTNINLADNSATSTGAVAGEEDEVTPPAGNTNTAGAPIATTNATVAPTDTTAVVTGTVNPRGALTTYWYEYGTTPNLGQKTANQSVGSGFNAIQTPGYITGLTKNTTYYFRLVAENSFGRTNGTQNTVKTTQGVPAPVGSAPTAKSIAANSITSTSANLRGEVDPNKSATQYWFEYGTSQNLGNTTSFTSIGSGDASAAASASIGDLSAGTTYYYRVNAQNQFGTVNGAIMSFKTTGNTSAAPTVSTKRASAIGTSTATLNATVDPNGVETKYWFEYSSDSLLSSVLLKTTSQQSAGAGNNAVQVEADVTGLNPKTTYYGRIVAQNAQGTVRGDKVSFKTD